MPNQADKTMDTQADKFTPPGLNTTVANAAEKAMGDREVSVTVNPRIREGEKQLTLQWYGNRGKSCVSKGEASR